VCGDAATAFRENMRGVTPMEDVITEAKSALGEIKKARGAAYNAAMADVRSDAKVLDFAEIENALTKTKADFTFGEIPVGDASRAFLL
jgi:hypothetical protein